MKLCEDHPRYTGKRKPRTQCKACAELYLAVSKPRVLPMPTRPHKDKKKYNRKEKHKKGYDE